MLHWHSEDREKTLDKIKTFDVLAIHSYGRHHQSRRGNYDYETRKKEL